MQKGTLIRLLRPDEVIKIGEVEIRLNRNGYRGQSPKPTRIRISAPKDLEIKWEMEDHFMDETTNPIPFNRNER